MINFQLSNLTLSLFSHTNRSLHDASSDVLGLKRSLNGPPRLTNSPNISSLNSQNANLNRLFQYPPPTSSLANIPIYQNAHLFTNPNLNSLNHFNLNQTNSNKNQLNLPIENTVTRQQQQDYLDTLNAARDSIGQSSSSSLTSNLNAPNIHQLNHRRRPSLLQSAAYSTDISGLQSQYLPYLNERFRENLNQNLLARNKATLLPHHFQTAATFNSLNPLSVASTSASLSLTGASNSITTQPFNTHQTHLNNLTAQSTPSLNFLQQNQTQFSYLDNEVAAALSKRPRLSSIQPLLIDTNSSFELIKKEPAYSVQVEAISPTPNEDRAADGSPIKSTKDDLAQQLGQVHREITQAENEISKLKKKHQEFEARTGKSSDLNELLESKQQSLTQVIYFENRVSSRCQ